MAAATSNAAPEQRSAEPDGFVLDITLLEVADPAGLVNMTDDNCGSTCEKTTCISAA
ncbi:FxLD family lanthipeptide [Streptomyces sp. NPDC003077]|uniref:FxLD family lanthipeptide n=1 Tax=Streptomyces sp. NPDC003077 TaxID=3154443 RepID=UPI0033BE9D07